MIKFYIYYDLIFKNLWMDISKKKFEMLMLIKRLTLFLVVEVCVLFFICLFIFFKIYVYVREYEKLFF